MTQELWIVEPSDHGAEVALTEPSGEEHRRLVFDSERQATDCALAIRKEHGFKSKIWELYSGRRKA